MKEFLYWVIGLISQIHNRILALNDGYANSLTDKQLHFIIIGALGMLLFFVIHPVFKALIRNGHEIVVSWFYVFTLIIVITFAIEIGQKVSNTGNMEFADIVFGVAGFLVMFAVFALIRRVVILLRRASQKRK